MKAETVDIQDIKLTADSIDYFSNQIMSGELEIARTSNTTICLRDLVREALADDSVCEYIIDAVKCNGGVTVNQMAIAQIIEHCEAQLDEVLKSEIRR